MIPPNTYFGIHIIYEESKSCLKQETEGKSTSTKCFYSLTYFSIHSKMCSCDREYVFKGSPNEAQIYWVQEYQLHVALTDRKQQVKGLCSHPSITANSCDPKHKDLHWQNFSWWFASHDCWTHSIINSNCDSASDNHSDLIDCAPPLSSGNVKTNVLYSLLQFSKNSQHSIFSIRLS